MRVVLFVGNGEFRFQKFKKGLRAFANRAKAHLLDQNQQSGQGNKSDIQETDKDGTCLYCPNISFC